MSQPRKTCLAQALGSARLEVRELFITVVKHRKQFHVNSCNYLICLISCKHCDIINVISRGHAVEAREKMFSLLKVWEHIYNFFFSFCFLFFLHFVRFLSHLSPRSIFKGPEADRT